MRVSDGGTGTSRGPLNVPLRRSYTLLSCYYLLTFLTHTRVVQLNVVFFFLVSSPSPLSPLVVAVFLVTGYAFLFMVSIPDMLWPP